MEASNQELRRPAPHPGYELKDAMRPGLFPLVADWPGVEELASEHDAALQQVREAFGANKRLRDQFQREDSSGRLTTDFSERQALLHEARIAEQAARRQTEVKVTELVADAREHLEAWRAVEDAAERDRRAEIAELRSRLAELETEDMTAKRLQVWLNRLDTERISPGLISWASLDALPIPPDTYAGPIARSFQPDLQEAAE